jgi:hypothetical protein
MGRILTPEQRYPSPLISQPAPEDEVRVDTMVRCKHCGEEPKFRLTAFEKIAMHWCNDGVIVLIDIVFRFDKTVAEVWNDWNT